MRQTLRRSAAGLVALLAVCAGCDGPAQYSSVKVNVLVHADGTGEMSWQVPGHVSGEQMATYGREIAAALGLPQPATIGTGEPATFTGLSSDRLDFEIDQLMTRLRELGIDVDSVFVSICTPHADGRVEGAGFDKVHFGSCGTWSSEGPVATAPQVTVRFGERWHPSSMLAVGCVIALLLGVCVSVLAARWKQQWLCATANAVCLIGALACGWAVWTSLTNWSPTDPYWETGMTFDENLGEGFHRTLLIDLVSTVLLTALWVVGVLRNRPHADLSS